MTHVILRQVIEILTDNATDVFILQQRLSDIYRDEVVPTMCDVFDACSSDDATLCIDQIIIDLGDIKEHDLQHPEGIKGLMISVNKQVSEQLRYGVWRRNSPGAVVSTTMYAFDQWLFYMANGYVNWNVVAIDEKWHEKILEAVSGQMKSVESLRTLIRNNDRALQRIVFQHTREFLTHLIEALTAQNQSALASAIDEVSAIIALLRDQDQGLVAYVATPQPFSIWREILLMISLDPTSEWTTERIILFYIQREFKTARLAKLAEILSDVRSDHTPGTFPILETLLPAIRKHLDSPQIQKEKLAVPDAGNLAPTNGSLNSLDQDQLENGSTIGVGTAVITKEVINIAGNSEDATLKSLNEDGLFVRHAGLVILHPFLSPFFREVRLIENGQFINAFSMQKGMLFLQYLATGEDSLREYEMIVAKLLCGVPFEDPFDTSLRLTDEEKIASEELLKDVIAQWTILKDTSPSGLREGFLQRPGKYYVKNNRHYLHVENSSIDVLLDRLPWGLSLIKLTWMKEVLNVEWR